MNQLVGTQYDLRSSYLRLHLNLYFPIFLFPKLPTFEGHRCCSCFRNVVVSCVTPVFVVITAVVTINWPIFVVDAIAAILFRHIKLNWYCFAISACLFQGKMHHANWTCACFWYYFVLPTYTWCYKVILWLKRIMLQSNMILFN